MKGTTDCKITYDKNTNKKFEVHVDVSFGGDRTRESQLLDYHLQSTFFRIINFFFIRKENNHLYSRQVFSSLPLHQYN